MPCDAANTLAKLLYQELQLWIGWCKKVVAEYLLEVSGAGLLISQSGGGGGGARGRRHPVAAGGGCVLCSELRSTLGFYSMAELLSTKCCTAAATNAYSSRIQHPIHLSLSRQDVRSAHRQPALPVSC